MEWIRMLGLFFRYFELAADEEGDGSVSEQVISRGDLRWDRKLLMVLEHETQSIDAHFIYFNAKS